MIRAILIILLTISTAGGASTEAAHGMVASVHPTATEAELRVLKEGGNAVDAVAAVALTLGVVDGDNSGIGEGCFIRGHFTQAVEQWMKSNGGIMTAEDFRNYRIILRKPVLSSYRGHTIVGFPPPSSGGVHVAQMLNILETFDLKALGETARLHVSRDDEAGVCRPRLLAGRS